MKVSILILALVVIPGVAGLKITEIMYNPIGNDDGREWLEIYNGENGSIDVSSLNLFEDGVNHRISLIKGNTVLSFGEYGIIADDWNKFLLEYNHSMNLFDSSFSLSNTGENLVIKNDSFVFDNLSYSIIYGGSDNGFSIGLVQNNWYEIKPSPGLENYVIKSNNCDWSVKILLDKNIFEKNEENWSIRVYKNYGNVENISFFREVRDVFGGVAKDYEDLVLNNIVEQKTYRYNPNLEEGKAYLINTSIKSLKCNDTNLLNNFDSKLIFVKGEPLTNKSYVKILEIYLGKDNKARFGDNLRIKVNIYKGYTEKSSISLWLGDAEEISGVSKTNVYDKFTNYTFVIPIQIDPNCNGKFRNKKYKLILEGLDDRDEEEISVNDITDSLCEKVQVNKNSSESKKKIIYELFDLPKEVISGEEIEYKLKISNNGNSNLGFDIWSYVYKGNKCVSGVREGNMKKVYVKAGENEEVELVNVIDKQTKEDFYKLKVKIKKDGLKTAEEINEDIKINSINEKVSEINLENSGKSKSLINGDNYSDMITNNIVYEGKENKTRQLGLWFFCSFLVLVCLSLVFWKIK